MYIVHRGIDNNHTSICLLFDLGTDKKKGYTIKWMVIFQKPSCPYEVVLCITMISHDHQGALNPREQYTDVMTIAMASQITGVSIVYSTVCSGTDQRKHQSSASLAFERVVHRWPMNSTHKGPVTRKKLQCDDVIVFHIFYLMMSSLIDCLSRLTSKKTPKLRVTGHLLLESTGKWIPLTNDQ